MFFRKKVQKATSEVENINLVDILTKKDKEEYDAALKDHSDLEGVEAIAIITIKMKTSQAHTITSPKFKSKFIDKGFTEDFQFVDGQYVAYKRHNYNHIGPLDLAKAWARHRVPDMKEVMYHVDQELKTIAVRTEDIESYGVKYSWV